MRKWREMKEKEICEGENEKKSTYFTVGEIKAIKGFENISDKEAQEVIDTLVKLCWMFCDLYHSLENFEEDESDKKLAA